MNWLRTLCSFYLLAVLAAVSGSLAWPVAGLACVALVCYDAVEKSTHYGVPALAVLLVLVSTQVQLDSFFSYATIVYFAGLCAPVLLAYAAEYRTVKGSHRTHAISFFIPCAVLAGTIAVFYGLMRNDLYKLYFFGSDTIFQIMVFAGLVTIGFFVVYDLLR